MKDRLVRFSMGGMVFEYDEEKNRQNIEKHGISFMTAARIFGDYKTDFSAFGYQL